MRELDTPEQYQKAGRVVSLLEAKRAGKICQCGHHRRAHNSKSGEPHSAGCSYLCGCEKMTPVTPTGAELERLEVGIDFLLMYDWEQENQKQIDEMKRRSRAEKGTLSGEAELPDGGTSGSGGDSEGVGLSETGLLRRQVQRMREEWSKAVQPSGTEQSAPGG